MVDVNVWICRCENVFQTVLTLSSSNITKCKKINGDICTVCVFQTDYYFEYTECDSTGSRWRVAIPHRQGSCSGLPEPVRGTDCSKKQPHTDTLNAHTTALLKISNQVTFNLKTVKPRMLWEHFLGFICCYQKQRHLSNLNVS